MNHSHTNNQNQIAETANAWYEEQKDVLDDGRFFQQYEKSVDKTWTLADPSSDESDEADVQKQDKSKTRLLSSKLQQEPAEPLIDYERLNSPAVSYQVQENRLRGKNKDVRTRPVKSSKSVYGRPSVKNQSQNIKMPPGMELYNNSSERASVKRAMDWYNAPIRSNSQTKLLEEQIKDRVKKRLQSNKQQRTMITDGKSALSSSMAISHLAKRNSAGFENLIQKQQVQGPIKIK